MPDFFVQSSKTPPMVSIHATGHEPILCWNYEQVLRLTVALCEAIKVFPETGILTNYVMMRDLMPGVPPKK